MPRIFAFLFIFLIIPNITSAKTNNITNQFEAALKESKRLWGGWHSHVLNDTARTHIGHWLINCENHGMGNCKIVYMRFKPGQSPKRFYHNVNIFFSMYENRNLAISLVLEKVKFSGDESIKFIFKNDIIEFLPTETKKGHFDKSSRGDKTELNINLKNQKKINAIVANLKKYEKAEIQFIANDKIIYSDIIYTEGYEKILKTNLALYNDSKEYFKNLPIKSFLVKKIEKNCQEFQKAENGDASKRKYFSQQIGNWIISCKQLQNQSCLMGKVYNTRNEMPFSYDIWHFVISRSGENYTIRFNLAPFSTEIKGDTLKFNFRDKKFDTITFSKKEFQIEKKLVTINPSKKVTSLIAIMKKTTNEMKVSLFNKSELETKAFLKSIKFSQAIKYIDACNVE